MPNKHKNRRMLQCMMCGTGYAEMLQAVASIRQKEQYTPDDVEAVKKKLDTAIGLRQYMEASCQVPMTAAEKKGWENMDVASSGETEKMAHTLVEVLSAIEADEDPETAAEKYLAATAGASK